MHKVRWDGEEEMKRLVPYPKSTGYDVFMTDREISKRIIVIGCLLLMFTPSCNYESQEKKEETVKEAFQEAISSYKASVNSEARKPCTFYPAIHKELRTFTWDSPARWESFRRKVREVFNMT